MPGKAVTCLACRHYCVIPDGQTGICGVRQNVNGKLNLLVYGKASGAAVDPMEKKPLYHFFPGSKIFSLGTIGCNFGCTFCQNWDTSQASKEFRRLALKGQIGPQDLKAAISESGFDLPPKKIVEYCLKHDIKAIAYTYNEPSIFFEYTYDTAKLAKEHGISNVYVTNGYTSPEALDKLEGLLDAANIDLKSFSDKFYRDISGARLDEVLKSIKYYYDKGIWLEITTLVIPGKNDSKAELTKIAEFIAGIDVNIPWHISRFSPHYLMQDIAATGKEKLMQAFNIGKKAGLNYVYVGNIFDEKLHSTYCPKCSALLVERDWDHVKVKSLKKGKCLECGFNIKGVWN
jgi:pyruvate formate lyase activating enzyme